jgi:hypothetical protein
MWVYWNRFGMQMQNCFMYEPLPLWVHSHTQTSLGSSHKQLQAHITRILNSQRQVSVTCNFPESVGVHGVVISGVFVTVIVIMCVEKWL